MLSSKPTIEFWFLLSVLLSTSFGASKKRFVKLKMKGKTEWDPGSGYNKSGSTSLAKYIIKFSPPILQIHKNLSIGLNCKKKLNDSLLRMFFFVSFIKIRYFVIALRF